MNSKIILETESGTRRGHSKNMWPTHPLVTHRNAERHDPPALYNTETSDPIQTQIINGILLFDTAIPFNW